MSDTSSSEDSGLDQFRNDLRKLRKGKTISEKDIASVAIQAVSLNTDKYYKHIVLYMEELMYVVFPSKIDFFKSQMSTRVDLSIPANR
jgi:hypothetical protein